MKLRYLFVFVFSGLFLPDISFSQDVPYVPTPYIVVEEMLSMAEVNKNDVLYDLGCGDGRIVITAAKNYGARGVGIDSNPKRIEESIANAESNNVSNMVEFKQQDLFNTDLSDATVVTLYLLTHVNIKLRPILFEQLKPGTRIVSHAFDMGDWEPEEVSEVDNRTIYFWRIPQNVSGRWDSEVSENNKEQMVLNLKQQFQKINGSVQMGDKNYQITNTKLEDDNIEFSFNDGTNDMTFHGKVKDDNLQGTLNGSNGAEVNWTAHRAANTQSSLDSGL